MKTKKKSKKKAKKAEEPPLPAEGLMKLVQIESCKMELAKYRATFIKL
jgi:hypothetical protein